MGESKARFLVLGSSSSSSLHPKQNPSQAKEVLGSHDGRLCSCVSSWCSWLCVEHHERHQSIFPSRTTEKPAFVPAGSSLVCEEKDRWLGFIISTRAKKRLEIEGLGSTSQPNPKSGKCLTAHFTLSQPTRNRRRRSQVMARGKLLPRGERELPSNRPVHVRKTRPIEIREITPDGIIMASEVPYYEVMPKARTERQLRWRRRIQKLGVYGNAVVIYPLTEIETELLNGMGQVAAQQFED